MRSYMSLVLTLNRVFTSGNPGNLEFEIACGNMLLEKFIISSLIFERQAIFNTLYTWKSSGKQDHCELLHF